MATSVQRPEDTDISVIKECAAEQRTEHTEHTTADSNTQWLIDGETKQQCSQMRSS
jgi:hypothetical protein